MIIRTKGGEFCEANSSVLCKQSLLDFFGVKNEAGVQRVSGDVELIAGVPFSMSNEELAMNNDNGFAWTLSTFDLDRFGERVDPAGWDFSQFVKNPVVEWAHRYDIPAIGKIEGLAVDDKGLHGLVIFNDKSFDAFGWGIGERVKAGVIRAGSVGFRVLEIEIPNKEDAPNGGKDGTSLIFRKQELLEFSICNVPANPYALTKTMSNEKLTNNNDNGSNATPYWGGLINNVER